MKFDKQYKNLIKDIMENGIEELNERTGIKVKALPGKTLEIDLEKEFPLLSLRKLSYSFIPEIMWMLSGSNTNIWLNKHTKIWDSFTEKDGTITSAYGYRWRKHFGIDQLDIVLNKLEKNKSDRHGVIMMWSPKEDLILKQKNVPCPYTFTLNIIGDKLHLHLVIRSNDMILGNPTDVAGFALLTYILAQELKVNVGKLTISISNAHIYENQYYVAEELIKRSYGDCPDFKLPENSYERACNLDDTLIEEIKNNFIGYRPRPIIKNIPIAL
jgi:thymidylate synthase